MPNQIIDQFINIRKDQMGIDRRSLPDSLPALLKNSEDFDTLFNVAVDYWTTVFNKDEFISRIKEYIDSSNAERKDNEALRKYFKSIRKAALILGSAYKFLNAEPSLPTLILTLIRYLGKFNDTFGSMLSVRFILRVRTLLENNNFEIHTLQRVAPEEFLERIQNTINLAKSFSLEGEILVSHYHEIRKDLRHLMNLFQLAAANDPKNLRVLQVFQYSCDLNSELGKLHDPFASLKIRKQKLYNHKKMTITADLLNKIQNFYKLIEQQFLL